MNKLLVVGPAWVGDMVMAQTLFSSLKKSNPALAIDVLAPAWSEPLLERMPEVNKSHVMPLGHGELSLKKRYEMAKQLRSEYYQQAIVLPNSWKSALIPFWARIPKRTGWRGEMRYGLLNDVRVLDEKALPLMIERFMALAYSPKTTLPKPYPKPSLQVSPDKISEAIATHKLNHANPILALCPGAEFGPSKRWPAEYYGTVAKKYLQVGWQVWIFGSPKDTPVAQEIQQHVDNACVDLTGKTRLGEAIDLMSLASLVLTNDSGLMHIAAALDKPLVAVYGSSSPRFTPPLNDGAKMLKIDISCSPCFKRECPLEHLNCMRELSPSRVLNALEEIR